jgi:hypothetical protein
MEPIILIDNNNLARNVTLQLARNFSSFPFSKRVFLMKITGNRYIRAPERGAMESLAITIFQDHQLLRIELAQWGMRIF